MNNFPWSRFAWDDLRHINDHPHQHMIAALQTLYTDTSSLAQQQSALQVLFSTANQQPIDQMLFQYAPTTLPRLLDFTLPLLQMPHFVAHTTFIDALEPVQATLIDLEDEATYLPIGVLSDVVQCSQYLRIHLDSIAYGLDYPQASVRRRYLDLFCTVPDVFEDCALILMERYWREPDHNLRHVILKHLNRLCTYRATHMEDRRVVPPVEGDHHAEIYHRLRWYCSGVLANETLPALRLEAIALSIVIGLPYIPQSRVQEILGGDNAALTLFWHAMIANPTALADAQLLQFLAHERLSQVTVYRALLYIGTSSHDVHNTTTITATAGRINVSLQEPDIYAGTGQQWQLMRLLRLIAQCDRFWAQPSNFLSTFFHLPDDRDALFNVINRMAGST